MNFSFKATCLNYLKIKLDKSGKAEGVYYIKSGVKRYARAKKEVIVSAGTVDSAKLLMLSGIGPRQHLRSVGVSKLKNCWLDEQNQNFKIVHQDFIYLDMVCSWYMAHFADQTTCGFASWEKFARSCTIRSLSLCNSEASVYHRRTRFYYRILHGVLSKRRW